MSEASGGRWQGMVEQCMDDPRLIEAMRQFVQAFSDCPDISLREELDHPELTIPVDLHGSRGTHYLLMAAAIDVGTNSNHIRPFLIRLHNAVPGGLFALTSSEAEPVLRVIDGCQRDRLLSGWQAKKEVPRILSDVNRFVETRASGDLDQWAKTFKKPHDVVKALAQGIYYQGDKDSEARKKMWMFMRWVVRPAPDLHLWTHLSPRDLMVPVDRHVARVAAAIGIISLAEASEPKRTTVEKITAWARQLFPDDPACVDYAFFMWGRGLSSPGLREDACYCHFRRKGEACPLASILPCGAQCGSLK